MRRRLAVTIAAQLSAVLAMAGCLGPQLTWSLEQTTWFAEGPVFSTGYYFTQAQCQDAIEGIRVSEGTQYEARCEPIEYAVGRSLSYFDRLMEKQ